MATVKKKTTVTTQSVSPADSDQLLKQLMKAVSEPGYKAKTAKQIEKQAKGEYKSYYDQLRLSAKQQQQQSDLALRQQRNALQGTYDKQREESRRQYAQNYSQADRQMLSRGMQRSSYAMDTLANINQEGARAQQNINDQQATAEGNIDAQRTQLAQQLAKQISQYDSSQAADVMNRIRELEDQEYQRGVTDKQNRNALSTQIYQILYQQKRDEIADQQWQAQFDEGVRQFNVTNAKKSSSGGYRRTSQKDKDKDVTKEKETLQFKTIWDQDPYDQFMNDMDGKKPGGRPEPELMKVGEVQFDEPVSTPSKAGERIKRTNYSVV